MPPATPRASGHCTDRQKTQFRQPAPSHPEGSDKAPITGEITNVKAVISSVSWQWRHTEFLSGWHRHTHACSLGLVASPSRERTIMFMHLKETASVLIAFDRHKEWQIRELKIRPPSGSMLLYSRNKVRYRKDGYCWKKRRDGKTIREDHMKLKVQGVECIYGSYVHSAILPTFHRRCYWLLQNPDIVLVHYLNVPYPDNTKLSIPVLSYDMEKKEWTKEELVDQLRPMLACGRRVDLGPEQEHMVEETIEDFVQQLINLRQDKSGKAKPHKCTPSCDKNFPHSKCTKDSSPPNTASLAHNRLVSMLQRHTQRSATQSVAPPTPELHTSQVVITPTTAPSSNSTQDLNHTAAAPAPLILNLASLHGSNGLIFVSGHNTSPISIINNSLTTPIHTITAATLDTQGRFPQPQILQTIPQVLAGVKQDDKLSQHIHNLHAHDSNRKSPVPMNIASDALLELAGTQQDSKDLFLDQMSATISDTQRNLHNTLDSLIRGDCSHTVGTLVKDNSGTDNCDTLDGSFSSFPSTDLNLDYLLDLPELYDCPDLPDTNASLGTSSGGMPTSVPLINCANCLSNQQAQQSQQQRAESHQSSTSTSATSDTQTADNTHSQTDTDSSFSQGVITDFSPDWCYTDGGTKILVTGPWFSTSTSYSVVFNSKTVPATLVQAGVLRCFTPAHDAGLVTLQVANDGFVISNSEVFEYKAREKHSTQSAHNEWFSMDSTEMKLLLVERLEQLEKRLMPADKNTTFLDKQHALNVDHENTECRLVQYVEHLAGRPWQKLETYPKAGHGGLTLLHLAAALGYAKLISSLVRWRSDISNLVLEYEVDAHSVDNHACTPLMWACARGNIDASLTLYHINTGPLSICNKDGRLPLTVARSKGHHNLANQIEQLEQARLQAPPPFPPCTSTASFAGATSSFTTSDSITACDLSPTPCHIFPSSHKNICDEKQENLHIDIPPPPPYPGDSKLVRRLSEQVIGTCHRQLSKRYSVDILPSGATNDQTSPQHDAFQKPIREANSEPHLSLVGDHPISAVTDSALLPVAQRDLASPDILMQTESLLNTIATESGKETDGLLMQMDTDEVSSVRSDSPFIDVEKISSDEEAEHKAAVAAAAAAAAAAVASGEGGDHEGKNQMVTLANQIIAAMPERIKLSPAKEEECGVSSRARSESYSSAPSQGSPPTSSFGDDSGISTPMTDSLAFDEYRYTDLGTPASSLSPDSTCLPSPYSPYSSYSFTLDSPPPTTADFTEYFNAPATYMEKDFSQLTLSDQEQRKLYEAAKVIQNAYRLYRDKQQLQQQRQKEIEAAILIQSYYRRYKQYAYFKKMTQAAVLIQNQFRSYYAQKRLKKNRDPAAGLQRQGPERLKKGRNQSVIIQQRYRSHYQRKTEKEGRQLSADAADSSPPPEQSSTSRDGTPPVDAEPDIPYPEEEDG
ncbi:calmodulin-binding transcription activator 2-like [Haliotis rufescens]|uniref:calmodulin-binding transcription activator 2-like n=1 Tax=Haliotis rufescens TaxID=6454 RepID=UPI00201F1425|nr:calmodulin-binding transcription activator 2-like [Haliotis rufescens]